VKSLFILFTLLLTSSAFASGTHCSGFSVHYSDLRTDRGTPPRPGDKLETLMLTVDGVMLGKLERFQDKPDVGTMPVDIRFNNKKDLAKGGGPAFGWVVYDTTIVIQGPGNSQPYEEAVTCKDEWELVP
jgi:hypothetical protein